MARFVPKIGESSNLKNLREEKGLFIITKDDRKIYTDVLIDGVLQRIPLGGDIENMYISWDMIQEKPFDTFSSTDFKIVVENDENNNVINKLFVADILKFNNKEILDKFSENDSGELLYNNKTIKSSGTMCIKGIVSSLNSLSDIEEPEEGYVYLITKGNSYDKVVYVIDSKEEGIGHWDPLYSTSYPWNSITDKPSINGVTLEGALSLEDLGIISGGGISADVITNIFDSTETYGVNDYVMYNNKLYKCIESHSGEWNSSHFQITDVISEFPSGGGGGGSSTDTYSLTEIDTGKKWIDGKTVYRRVFDAGVSANSGSVTTNVNANDNNIDKMIHSWVVSKGNSSQGYCMTYTNSSGYIIIANSTDNGNVADGIYLILEYTKTT